MSEETLSRQDAGAALGISVWSEDDGRYLVACPEHVDTTAVDCLVCEPVDDAAAPPEPARAAIREEIRTAINTALFNGGHPAASTGWSPSEEVDRRTAAVLAILTPRPMLDREELLVEMGRPDGAHNTKSPEVRAYAYETLYGRYADAAMRLVVPVPTRAQIEDIVLREVGEPYASVIAEALLALVNGDAS